MVNVNVVPSELSCLQQICDFSYSLGGTVKNDYYVTGVPHQYQCKLNCD